MRDDKQMQQEERGALLPALPKLSISRSIERLMGLPMVRDVVFLVCVLQKKMQHHPVQRPYTSDIGPLLVIGGLPHPVDSWVNPSKNLINRVCAQVNPPFGLVVSMVQPHEQKGTALRLLHAKPPIQEEEWRQWGLDYFHCPTQDFTTNIDFKKIFEALKKMYACVCSGKAVYMHCQAGEGRAFILLMSFLGVYGKPLLSGNGEVTFKKFSNYEAALLDVKKVRPQVAASKARREIVLEIVTYCLQRTFVDAKAATPSA